MREKLAARLEELAQAEKTAWANLNFILGRKAEVEELLATIPTEAGEG